jgi:outer membrane receptor protein involved in Fe transport
VNIDHRINDKIKLSYSSTFINSSADRGVTNNDNAGVTFGVALSSTPSFGQLFPDANGNYPNNPYAASNPLQTRDLMTNNELSNRYIGGVNLYAIIQKSNKMTTRIIARGGLDYYNLKTTAVFPSILQFEVNTTKGHSIQGMTNNVNTNWAGFLVNSYKPADDLSFITTAGLTYEYGKYDNILNVATQLIGIQTHLDQAGAINVSQFRTQYKNDGVFVQEAFAFKNYLNITAGLRFDQSTNNGDYKKYFTYPKANVAWNLSKLNIWKSKTINYLKLRVSYGESSSFPAYISRFTPLNSSNIGGYPGSLVSNTLGDGSIGSERQTELEAGVDISVLEGKLSLEATVYNKVVKDLLMQGLVPASTVFATKYLNAGSLRNRGIELCLKAIPYEGKNFRWTSTTNFWLNRSLITQLNIPAFPLGAFGTTLGTYFIQQGASATQIVGLNGNGGIGKFGDAEPTFQMNFLNDFTIHKNWSLRFLIHCIQGGDVINLTQLLTDLGGTSPDFDVMQSNGKTAGENRIAALGVSSKPFVQYASFVKYREIGLYYTVPYRIKNIERIQLGISANNLFVITPYVGYDPEVSNLGVGFSSGVDVTPFPTSKRVQFHVAISF